MRINNGNYDYMQRTLANLGRHLIDFATSMGCNKNLVQTEDDRYKSIPNKAGWWEEYQQFKQEFLGYLVEVNVKLCDLGIDPIVIDYDGVMTEFRKTQKKVNE